MPLTAEQLEEARTMLAGAVNGHQAQPAAGWNSAQPALPTPAASFGSFAAAGFQQPAAGGLPEKLLVPIKLQTPNGGTVRLYLQFPGELAANPQTLMAALAQLASVLPLDVYVKQQAWGGRRNGGGGWGGNGGW